MEETNHTLHRAAGLIFALLIASGASPIHASNPIADLQAGDSSAGVAVATSGGGHYLVGGVIEVGFSFGAQQKLNGAATGWFRHSTELGGLPIEFFGSVTCVSVDEANGRAWIGGVITQNNSEFPSFTDDVHQPGREIWFRVLDSGEGAGAEADRSTFVGFEGNAGIITSQEYCDLQIWPDDNARTSPVVSGDIQVRP